jgi:hypothetical protein
MQTYPSTPSYGSGFQNQGMPPSQSTEQNIHPQASQTWGIMGTTSVPVGTNLPGASNTQLPVNSQTQATASGNQAGN